MKKLTIKEIPVNSWEETIGYLNLHNDAVIAELNKLRRANRRHGIAIIGLGLWALIFDRAIVELKENYEELKKKLEAQEKTE